VRSTSFFFFFFFCLFCSRAHHSSKKTFTPSKEWPLASAAGRRGDGNGVPLERSRWPTIDGCYTAPVSLIRVTRPDGSPGHSWRFGRPSFCVLVCTPRKGHGGRLWEGAGWSRDALGGNPIDLRRKNTRLE
jgi:hypothetical protein